MTPQLLDMTCHAGKTLHLEPLKGFAAKAFLVKVVKLGAGSCLYPNGSSRVMRSR